MPTVDGKPTAEDIVALLQTNPSAWALSGHMDLFAGGLADLVNRVRNLEHRLLENNAIAKAATDANATQEQRLTVLEGDGKDYKARIAKIETAPAENTKRIDDLEKRVRTVEGAVGSASFKAAKEAPAKPEPFTGPAATEPVAEHKEGA